MSFRQKTLIFAILLVAGASFLILKGNWPLDKVGDTYTGINIDNEDSEPVNVNAEKPEIVEFAKYDTPLPVPAIQFFGPDGASYSLDSWEGQKLIVNFWATWCAPCVEELPRLNLLKQELKARGVNMDVITISMDTQQDFEDIQEFLRDHKAGGLPAFMDTERTVLRNMEMSGFPVTYMLNEQGQEITRYEGPLEWDDPKVIEALLRL